MKKCLMPKVVKWIIVLIFMTMTLESSATVWLIGNRTKKQWSGLSTDTKPTPTVQEIGASFREIDTGYYYLWNSSTWNIITETMITLPKGWAIVEGALAGHSYINKFGHNSAVSASLEEIWDVSAPYVYMTSASTLYASSDDTNDDQDYEIQGLDANWDAQIDTVTVNGFNFVAIDGTWIRIFRAKNIGSTDNAGNIYFSDDNTDLGGDGVPDDLDNCKARVTIGFNQTLMAIWSVPANKTAYMVRFYSSTSSSKATEVHLYIRPFGGVFQIKKVLTIFEGTDDFFFPFPLVISVKSDIVIKASAVGGGGEVSAGFDLWYK